MKVLFAIIVCKILYFVGKLVGKGSSLPGKIALRICPDALKRLKLPKTIIAVTGSNGKTTTVEMIAHALESTGMKIGCNREGSNQTEGVATLLLRIATLGGNVKRNALVLECDERYARSIFENLHPSVLLVTNLCRDQLTRNGHPEFIQDCIRAAICENGSGDISCVNGRDFDNKSHGSPATKLVLNADDPYTSALAISECPEKRPLETSWFGAGPDLAMHRMSPSHVPLAHDPPQLRQVYDDGAFCPICKERMSYEYRVFAHFGAYRCAGCGLARHEPDIEVAGFDSGTGTVTLEGGITTRLALPSLVGAYNLAAAIATAEAVGVSPATSASSLDCYELAGGRAVRFTAGDRNGIMLVSKHENSLSYNQSLEWAIAQGKPCTVIVLVDAISRKYYTSETSWLWDVDFDILANECVQSIILSGRYINELAARFAMTAIDPDKISYAPDLGNLRDHTLQNSSGEICAITCFSDKHKIIKAFGN